MSAGADRTLPDAAGKQIAVLPFHAAAAVNRFPDIRPYFFLPLPYCFR